MALNVPSKRNENGLIANWPGMVTFLGGGGGGHFDSRERICPTSTTTFGGCKENKEKNGPSSKGIITKSNDCRSRIESRKKTS